MIVYITPVRKSRHSLFVWIIDVPLSGGADLCALCALNTELTVTLGGKQRALIVFRARTQLRETSKASGTVFARMKTANNSTGEQAGWSSSRSEEAKTEMCNPTRPVLR